MGWNLSGTRRGRLPLRLETRLNTIEPFQLLRCRLMNWVGQGRLPVKTWGPRLHPSFIGHDFAAHKDSSLLRREYRTSVGLKPVERHPKDERAGVLPIPRYFLLGCPLPLVIKFR